MKALKLEKFALSKNVQVKQLLTAKVATMQTEPAPKKVPVLIYTAGESRHPHNMVFTVNNADIIGEWSWGEKRNWKLDYSDCCVSDFLKTYTNKTWREIEDERVGKKNPKKPADARNKSYSPTMICSEAWLRLVAIGKDDQETIFRFRTGGEPRIYGFIDGITFFVLWYDHKHKVYPMKKK